MQKKQPISEEMREFFRQCGRRGGQARNRVVSKKEMSKWGRAGARKSKKVVTKAQNRKWGRKGARVAAERRSSREGRNRELSSVQQRTGQDQ